MKLLRGWRQSKITALYDTHGAAQHGIDERPAYENGVRLPRHGHSGQGGDAEPGLDKAERHRKMLDFVEPFGAPVGTCQAQVENKPVTALPSDRDERKGF